MFTNQATKYEIFHGAIDNGRLTDQRIAGFSLLIEGNSYYLLRLMMFPHTWYYLSKNRESQGNYTLFAKCVRSQDGVKFQDPVGSATLNENLKTHLELRFHLLNTNVYMNLFPKVSS